MKHGLMAWAHSAKRMCVKSVEEALKEFNLSYVELAVLLFLDENPALDTGRDIADGLLLAKSNISTAVESLVQRGYLRREPDPVDRRLVHLKLMDTARILIQRGEEERQKMIRQMFDGFTRAEMEVLQSFSDRVYDNIQEMLRE
ncbi:MAG: MarR family transcriptional regulator [Candidatus Onthomonas sp.]|nr:MarR family transcriptional regulator [Candidatus Onthomonas sp.]